MNYTKISKFICMNSYEKKRSIIRNIYRYIYKNKFKGIGKKSYFLNPMFISGMKYIQMGKDVGIWDQARVEMIDEWEGERFTPELIIGDHVNIGQNLHLTCARRIVIEDNVVCTARVTITDIIHITSNKSISVLKQGIHTKEVRICEGAFIGVNTVILPGVTIGKHAVVGANSVVTKNIPDFAVVAGVPAREIDR